MTTGPRFRETAATVQILALTPVLYEAYHRAMEVPRVQSTGAALVATARQLVVAVRPKQWTKNLIIYFALFFSINEVWDPADPAMAVTMVVKATLAFFIFCALSGGGYIINDILDIDRDREHPRKRLRPIASGRLPIPIAWSAAFVLTMLSLGLALLLEPLFGWVTLGYLTMMLAYSLVLKRVLLLDVFSISGGFVLRAVAGAAVLQAPISPWLYACTGLGALLIALSKRRSELSVAGESAGRQRETLEWYTTSLLDLFIAIVAPSTLMAYTLYTFTAANLPENHAMMLTVPIVVYGLFRYLYLVHVKDLGENPEDILITDVPLIISIALWLATAATVLVVFRTGAAV